MKDFIIAKERTYLMKRMGDISQLAGVRRYEFTEWKMMNESEYVLGMEPGNCNPVGRIEQRKRGDLETMEPGEKKTVELEIGILTDKLQILLFEEKVSALNKN